MRVELLSLAAENFSSWDEPSEALAMAIQNRFVRAAKWLAKQPTAVFKELRQAGAVTDVFIGAWIEQNQIDLLLPPEFLKACGKHGLAVDLLSND